MKFFKFLILFVIIFTMLYCSETRIPALSEESEILSYQVDIKPILDANCIACHSVASKEGNYDVSSFIALQGKGTDNVRNAIAGDENSLLIQKIASGGSMNQYVNSSEDYTKIRDWIVDHNMYLLGPSVHENGFLEENSANFHGTLLKNSEWNFENCTSCHGTDFKGGSASKSCYDCHEEGPKTCTTCHGGEDNFTGAPPQDLSNNTDTGIIGVGLHTLHLTGTDNASALTCRTCHIIPENYNDASHIDQSENAEVVFSGLAVHNNSNPVWNRNQATCTASYCHGNFNLGNTDNSPLWILLRDESCGTCHETPPSGISENYFEHNSSHTNCSKCHYNIIDQNQQFTDKTKHINGESDLPSLNCLSCHGGFDNSTGAPPNDTKGNSSISDVTVGMHTLHLEGDSFSPGFTCSTCHVVPSENFQQGHLDDSENAEITFSGLSSIRGASPIWDRTSETCSSSYCHGNFPGGDSDNLPKWTDPKTSSCGTCHALPVSGLTENGFQHYSNHENCSQCHKDVINSNFVFIVKEKHVDGSNEVPTNCIGCHGGTDNTTGAPPNDLNGNTSTDLLTVGAHTKHLEGGTFSDGFECTVCHVVPSNILESAHMNGTANAEVVFSGIAVTGGANPQWDRSTATCSAVYCHGEFASGNKPNNPPWAPKGEQYCGSCHGLPPIGPTTNGIVHHYTWECYVCHGSVIDENRKLIDKAKHINGLVDFN